MNPNILCVILLLHNRCDADPGALAKYVVALLKKDKPLGDLEEICIDQLEVFLGRSRFAYRCVSH